MSRFIGDLVLNPNDSGRLWTLRRPFQSESDLLQIRITVPVGFITDGASVPRPFWNLIPPWGPYGRIAVIHDYMYRWRKYPRRMADNVLLEGMWVSGCDWWEFAIIFNCVRLFGWHGWRLPPKFPLSLEELAPNDPVVSLEEAKIINIDI